MSETPSVMPPVVSSEMKQAAEMAEHLSKTMTAIACVESISLVITWKDEKFFPVGVISTANNKVRPSIVLKAIRSLNQFASTLSERLLTSMAGAPAEAQLAPKPGVATCLKGCHEAEAVQPQ